MKKLMLLSAAALALAIGAGKLFAQDATYGPVGVFNDQGGNRLNITANGTLKAWSGSTIDMSLANQSVKQLTNNTRVPVVTRVGSQFGPNGGLYISSSIPFTSEYESVIGSNTAITLTSIPSISTGPASGGCFTTPQYLVLTSSFTTVTLQSNGTLSGSGLKLGAATRAIAPNNVLSLAFNPDTCVWMEESFSANTGN